MTALISLQRPSSSRKGLTVSFWCALLLLDRVNASPFLRDGLSRNLLPEWFCSFFDDTIDHHCQDNETQSSNITCPVVRPLTNDTTIFDLSNFTAHSWFVQKQQVNGFQPTVDEDFFCLVHTFVPRWEDDFLDYVHYGTKGSVDGPPQVWDVGDIPESLATWCAGQDDEGGGFLRISPCLLRSLLSRIGFPMWIIDVAPDYSWAIISGGEPDDLRQIDPPLCTTRTNVSAEVLADSSGTGLWLLTKERIASNETIAEMEDVLYDKGIYTGDLFPVVQEGCSYFDTDLIE